MDTIDKIRELRHRTSQLWDLAVTTCADRNALHCRQARHFALMRWDDAISMLEWNDVTNAIESLGLASKWAKQWGDDSPEREAIQLLEGL